MIETIFVTSAVFALGIWLKTIGIQELWKKPLEKRFQEDDVQEQVNIFLSLWAAGFEADTIKELHEIMDLAWLAFDKIESLLDKEYYVPPGTYFSLMDWESTGYPQPAGRWRIEMFRPQLMKLGAWS